MFRQLCEKKTILFVYSDCTKHTAIGLAVLRMTDELTEILKWNLWLEFEHAHDSNHFSYNESNLLEQYNTFMTMHGPDSKECLQIFGIRMGEKVMRHTRVERQIPECKSVRYFCADIFAENSDFIDIISSFFRM